MELMSVPPEREEDSLNTVADRLLGLNEPATNEEGPTVPGESPLNAVLPDNELEAAEPAGPSSSSVVPPHLPPGPNTSKARALAAGQINHIVEEVLPDGMHLSRDARVALQKVASVTLLYLACLADEARKEKKVKRSTLSVQDIHAALELAGMGHLVPQMHVAAKRNRQ